jgi:hypothetical protein
MRAALALMLLVAVSACVGPPRGHRPSSHGPVRVNPDIRQCIADLSRAGAKFTPMPDQDFGNGCSSIGTVQIMSVAGIPVTNTKATRCPLALAVSGWVGGNVQRAARTYLGQRVVRVESMGSFACRNVNGAASGRLSEHAFANAIDIAGFVLEDGRRVTVQSGWSGASDEQQFLRAVHDGACNVFVTVLSPDYNAQHHDHLHFDMGGRKFCR